MRPLLIHLIAVLLPSSAVALDKEPLRLAIEDLRETFGARYLKADEFIERLGKAQTDADLAALRREALLANPLLDFDRILLIHRRLGDKARSAMSAELGVGTLNAHTNDTLRRTGWDNRIAILSQLRSQPRVEPIHQPDGGKIVADLELHPDAKRVMFSSIGTQGNWRVFETDITGTTPRQLTPDDGADVGHFDSCYLPDDRVVFASTAVYQGLPCEAGNRQMVCLYQLDPRTSAVRQLTFEQDSDWCPTVLPDGRVMYLRWEYSDLAHSNSRILFQMNPDGTGQAELYGSNSYFPNSFFHARPMPGHPSKIIGVAGGHHGIARSGRLLIIDPTIARREADGVVQEIPGRGRKVEAVVRDRLVDGVWPQFLMPFPLSEKYVLVSCKPAPDALWGLYLVDVFDNMTLIHEEEGSALLEPIAIQPVPRAPRIPDRIDPARSDATVLLSDIYQGPGLDGIPKGAVKNLRVIEYYFSKRGTGGLIGSIGMDGPWDIKRVLGTVPVEPDGSAHFRIPANTPVAVQPLDDDGQALQLMRSWFVGMPGERVSCVGCHEGMNQAPPPARALAASKPPVDIHATWQAPTRGFSFAREVQPVLDRHCVSCHAGGPGHTEPYLKGDRRITDWSSQMAGNAGGNGGKFTESYAALHRYIRRPGIESDLHLLSPMDYHFSTTGLGRLLRNGHHGVKLDRESFERIVTWADLNAPFHGTWGEIVGPEKVAPAVARADELRRRYAPSGPFPDYEKIPQLPEYDITPVVSPPVEPVDLPVTIELAAEAPPQVRKLDLGGVTIDFVRIPGGKLSGNSLESFWIGRCEVTNEQFRRFVPDHNSRHESRHGYQFGRLGYEMNGSLQPAVRVSWNEAQAFANWIGERHGVSASLPDAIQWEWACRAGGNLDFPFGPKDADYSPHSNLGDRRLKEFAACTARGNYTLAEPINNPNRYDDWIPRDDRFDDGSLVTSEVGRYRPNAFGLHDMIGNAWEWTNETTDRGERIARGGSWYERPDKATVAARAVYQPFQRVFDVGFRVVFTDRPVAANPAAGVVPVSAR